MRATYDPEAKALYIYVREDVVDHMKMLGPFLVDMTLDDKVVGYELLNVEGLVTFKKRNKLRRLAQWARFVKAGRKE